MMSLQRSSPRDLREEILDFSSEATCELGAWDAPTIHGRFLRGVSLKEGKSVGLPVEEFRSCSRVKSDRYQEGNGPSVL